MSTTAPSASKASSTLATGGPGRTLAYVYHGIDADLVAACVARKVKHLSEAGLRAVQSATQNLQAYQAQPKSWSRPPADPAQIEQIYARFVQKEREHYSTVRVVERLATGDFVLVYGEGELTQEQIACGTGPFKSLAQAAGWFLRDGR